MLRLQRYGLNLMKEQEKGQKQVLETDDEKEKEKLRRYEKRRQRNSLVKR